MTFSQPTITAHHSANLPKAAEILRCVGLAVVSAHETFSRWREHRRDLRILGGLSDTALKDIGLSRADVCYVSRMP